MVFSTLEFRNNSETADIIANYYADFRVMNKKCALTSILVRVSSFWDWTCKVTLSLFIGLILTATLTCCTLIIVIKQLY